MNLTHIPYRNGFVVVSDEEAQPYNTMMVNGEPVFWADGYLGKVGPKIVYQSEYFVEGVPLAVMEDDVDLLSDEYAFEEGSDYSPQYTDKFLKMHFTEGYNKRAATHKWTDDDMRKAIEYGYAQANTGTALFEDQFIQSLQTFPVEVVSTEDGRTILKRNQTHN